MAMAAMAASSEKAMPQKKFAGSASKRQNGTTTTQPARFGIQHFFSRQASSQQPPLRETQMSSEQQPAFISPNRPPKFAARQTANTQSQPLVQEHCVDTAQRKRMRLSPVMMFSQTQDEVDEVVWKASPTAERLNTSSSAAMKELRLALHPSQSKPSNFRGVCNLISPCSKISPGMAGKLESWLTASTWLHDTNKENENLPTAVDSMKFISDTKGTNVADKPMSKSVKKVRKRQAKLGKHRKALLDLLDQVQTVIVDDKPDDDKPLEKAQENASDFTSTRALENNLYLKHYELEENRIGSAQVVQPIPNEVKEPAANIHFLVLEVSESEFFKGEGDPYRQKVLRLLDEVCGTERMVYLRDEWCFTSIRPGETVNVVGNFEENGSCVIDHENNLLVIHPDILISGSRVGSSFACPRRAVLDDRIKSSDTSAAALLGTMLHRLFQSALSTEEPTQEFLELRAQDVVLDNIDGLYAIEADEKNILAKLVAAIPTILGWIRCFKNQQPSLDSNVDFGPNDGKHPVSVSEVVDIEEMVWSPKYGLKGMIDASVKTNIGNSDAGDESKHMPVEFKTGKATTGQAALEHRAQVILYTLLMSDRYSENVNKGLLYYLHTNQTQGVAVQHADLSGLVMRRNEHAANLLIASSTQSLPPMLQASYMCQSCRMLNVCSVYHKTQEGGTAESSGLGNIFDALTGHLSEKHAQFLRCWDNLIDLEAQAVYSSQSEIWRMPSLKREAQGKCLSFMVIDAITTEHGDGSKADGYVYSFKRASTPKSCESARSLQDQSFSCGDYVLLSTESGHSAVAGGIVKRITSECLSVRLSRRLRLPPVQHCSAVDQVRKELWRIDKDDKGSSLAIMRYNLLQLFVKDGDERSRQLIVDLEVPRFGSTGTISQDPAIHYVRSVPDLNQDQRSAIGKILAATDYALVLGMPGTGKTSTIAHAVKALMARGSSVLLTSYTNSAVDNILLKLEAQGVDFVRIGRPEAIHPHLAKHAISDGVASVEDLRRKVEQAQVVGATCLGITHAVFTKRKFDVCIIDEAGQITLPVCVGPLRYAHSFVLVGDHYQLPPLVQNPEAREKGLAISLFRRLCEAHPQAVSALQSQYRMCSDIMNLSNVLIYGNRLRCGSPEVANAQLDVNISKNLPLWTQQVLEPSRRVVFLDTDFILTPDKLSSNGMQNLTEAALLLKIICALRNGNVVANDIGVISPYKAQVDYVRRLVSEKGYPSIEVHTIDKYQGRDKDCILLSFVRSRNQRVSGSLLTDWHRVNVAITRAKRKLIMVGSSSTLSTVPLLDLLLKQVDEQGGFTRLPQDACM